MGGRFLPSTTMYWPPAETTPSTPGIFLIAAVSALSSDFRMKRSRVMQWDTDWMFSVPPTNLTISDAIC